jgi:hypothetical protein
MYKGYEEVIEPRPDDIRYRGMYACCDHNKRKISYFRGWWLIFIEFLKIHERTHVDMRKNNWSGEDCTSMCIMTSKKGVWIWLKVLFKRLKEGTWFCPYCELRRTTKRA